MKALIAAGGRAKRLRPITQTINKHLIPLAGKPLLENAIEKLRAAGITEIAINVNPDETEVQRVIGDGSRWDARITYIPQTGGAMGVAHAVANAKTWIGDEPFVYYLGDNIVLGSIDHLAKRFEYENLDCLLTLAKVADARAFGCPVIEGDRIVRVIEKPKDPPSPYAVTGIYFYKPCIFDAIATLKPSARGEYEISDAHTWLIENGKKVGHQEITGWWKDTGKPEDLLEGNALLLNELRQEDAVNRGNADSSAKIQGKVRIGKGTNIGPRCLVRGPATIGEDCVIENAFIGPNTELGNRVTVRNTEIEHSIVLDDATIESGCRIVDAIIGRNASVMPADETLPRGHRLIIGDNSVVEL